MVNRGTNIVSGNVRSLKNNLSELRLASSGKYRCIYAFCETLLDEEVLNTELFCNKYTAYRRDRNKHGGGLLFLVSNKSESRTAQYANDCCDIAHKMLLFTASACRCSLLFYFFDNLFNKASVNLSCIVFLHLCWMLFSSSLAGCDTSVKGEFNCFFFFVFFLCLHD